MRRRDVTATDSGSPVIHRQTVTRSRRCAAGIRSERGRGVIHTTSASARTPVDPPAGATAWTISERVESTPRRPVEAGDAVAAQGQVRAGGRMRRDGGDERGRVARNAPPPVPVDRVGSRRRPDRGPGQPTAIAGRLHRGGGGARRQLQSAQQGHGVAARGGALAGRRARAECDGGERGWPDGSQHRPYYARGREFVTPAR